MAPKNAAPRIETALRERTVPLQALLDSESRLQCAIELAFDYYWEQDEHCRFTFFRHRDTGQAANDPWLLLGKACWEHAVMPASGDGAWDEHKAVCQARRPFAGFVVRQCEPNGVQRYLSISGQPMVDTDGRFRGYRGIAKDVTKEMRHEQLLTLERAVARALAEAENTSDALQSAIRAICESEGWDAGQYWRLDERAKAMLFHVGWSVADSAIQLIAEEAHDVAIEPGAGLVGSVWRTGKPLWVADLQQESRLLRKDIVQRRGWNGAFLFPVLSKEKIIGVLDFNARHIAEPDEDLLQVIRTLSVQIGTFYSRAAASEQLRESEARYSSTVELAAIGISHVAKDGRFIHVNRQLCEMLGYTRENLLEMTVKEISHPEDVSITDNDRARLRAGEIDSFRVEKRYLRKDGTPVWVRIAIAQKTGEDGEVLYDISVIEDISERKRAEERVQYLATHDELTNLPNRSRFGEVVTHAIDAAQRSNTRFCVLFIDLDRFKIVNDSLGHEAGDLLLKEISVRLKACVRANDVVARLGGDEFVVLANDVNEPGEIAAVARNILSAVLKPVEIMGQECRVTASIGISTYSDDAEDAQSLLKNADMAMYLAKEEGKNNYQYYSKEIRSLSIERLAMETQLRHALERNEFSLQYQAKVNVHTGEIKGVEALLRWWNHQLGAVPPSQFIPVAEDTGLIVPIGRWVLRTACEQSMAWRQQGLPPVCMAVNLSPRQFKAPDLLENIAKVLEETGVPPELLELEITESMIMNNVDQAISVLTAIKALGVRLAIDDFGTGYSSLAQLKRFPIDTLKVDRSFIRDIPRDGEDKAITAAIIAMGRTLGVTVVAEGVETLEQQAFLNEHACDEMQGFYFSKPTHPHMFAMLLRSHSGQTDGARYGFPGAKEAKSR